MPDSLKTIVIIPVFNEGGIIGGLVEKMPRDIVDTVLVVDDGSTDATAQTARSKGAVVAGHQKRKGAGVAIGTGIKYALEHKYDIIVVMAGNGKDNPEEIHKLIKPIVDEGYDYIQGSRYLKGGDPGRMPFHRRFGTQLYPRLLKLTTGFKATDGTNGFRAYKAGIFDDKRIDVWQRWLGRTGLEFYLSYKVIKLGYRIKEVPVSKIYPETTSYRKYTKTIPVLDWWQILKPMIFLTLRLKR